MDTEIHTPTPEQTIDALPERITSAQLAAALGVNPRRLERERERGAVPPHTCKIGRGYGYEREVIRPWLLRRLTEQAAAEHVDRENVRRLIRDYGSCHVSDYYIHGHAPYMCPVVFRPEPPRWPTLDPITT